MVDLIAMNQKCPQCGKCSEFGRFSGASISAWQIIKSNHVPTGLFTRLESLAWSQQGFWQPIFCRKRNLWSLCCSGRTEVVFLCNVGMEKKKIGNHSTLHISFPPGKQWREAHPYFPRQNKGFINHSFCKNWAVRNPTGTRLDSLAW